MSIESGLIMIWNSDIASIPPGWVECDGNNGTPDLRDRFVVGAGDTYTVGDTGGAQTHDHDFTGDGHSHATGGPTTATLKAGAGKQFTTDTHVSTGTTELSNHDPPYFSLVYIMFL